MIQVNLKNNLTGNIYKGKKKSYSVKASQHLVQYGALIHAVPTSINVVVLQALWICLFANKEHLQVLVVGCVPSNSFGQNFYYLPSNLTP
jgi:hypothetical protein